MNALNSRVLGRILIVLVLTIAFVMPVSQAFASGATSYTETYHNATDSFGQYISCINSPATVYITYNGVLHFTVNKAGDFWGTGTQTGTVVAVPLDSSLPTYTGHFTTWFGENDNLQNGTQTSTFSVHATGSDGSSLDFHEVEHISSSASGATISFDKLSCQ